MTKKQSSDAVSDLCQSLSYKIVTTPEDKPDMIMAKSGGWIYFDNPYASDSFLEVDLRHHLPAIKRYNAGADWQLLQHLLLVAELVDIHIPHDMLSPGEFRLAKRVAASHDVHEVHVGDMVSGLKIFCPDYQHIEDMWEQAARYHYGLPAPDANPKLEKLVKALDTRAVVIETGLFARGIGSQLVTPTPITGKEMDCVAKLMSRTSDQNLDELFGLLWDR